MEGGISYKHTKEGCDGEQESLGEVECECKG